MFTGIIQYLCPIESQGDGRLVLVSRGLPKVKVGGSIAINGVCLTVVKVGKSYLTFDVMQETLRRTNLGELKRGDRVNVEFAARMGDPIGGHFVQGHVDGVGEVKGRTPRGNSVEIRVRVPRQLARFMVEKGSVAVDGVSLTLVSVGRDSLAVSLIPETLRMTTLGRKGEGDSVNLEVDMLAKLVYRCVGNRWPKTF